MPPKRPAPSPERDGLPTTDHMDRLCAAYEKIAEELGAIRHTLDRLGDDFAWLLDNREEMLERVQIPVTRLTSMALDPLAADFGERINSVAPSPCTPASQSPGASASPGLQRELWS